MTRLSRRLYFLQSVTSAGGACARARAAKPGIRDQGRPASAASARLQGRSVELWSQQGGSVSCRRAKEHELRILHTCWHAGHSMALPAGGFISHARRPRIGATGSWGRHIKFSPDQLQTTGRGLRAENSGMQADFLEPALPGTASPCGGESGLFRCPPQLGSDSSPIPATGSAAPLHVTGEGGRRTVPPLASSCVLCRRAWSLVLTTCCAQGPRGPRGRWARPLLSPRAHLAVSPQPHCAGPRVPLLPARSPQEAKEPMGPWQARGCWCPGEAALGKGPPCVPSVFCTRCSLFSCLRPGSWLRPRPCVPGVADVE